jgi:hypothetical protein
VFFWRHVLALVWRRIFLCILHYQEDAHIFLSPKQLTLSYSATQPPTLRLRTCLPDQMDPLSIAFGVITLLELTKKIIIYAKQTKDAPADRTRVLQEASSLTGLLSTLKDFIEDCDDSEDPWLHATSSLTAQDGPLHQCRLTLESIVAKLTSIRGHGKIGQALAWVFSKEEVARLLAQIERVKSFVQIALQIDHTSVLLLRLIRVVC